VLVVWDATCGFVWLVVYSPKTRASNSGARWPWSKALPTKKKSRVYPRQSVEHRVHLMRAKTEAAMLNVGKHSPYKQGASGGFAGSGTCRCRDGAE
jgi:hypothetical protein